MRSGFKFTCYIFVCIFVLSCLLNINVFSENTESLTDAETVQISNEEIRERTNNLSLHYMGTDIDLCKDSFVISFDVSSNNECVLLFNNATVVVFDSEGEVYSILKFNNDVMQTRQRDFCVKWLGENIELILGYGITYHFTTNGNLVEVLRYRDISDVPNPQRIMCDDYVYEMKNNNVVSDLLGFGNYNMFVRGTNDGAEEVLFESEASLPFIAIFLILYFVGLFMFAAFVLIPTFVMIKVRRKLKNARNATEPSDETTE